MERMKRESERENSKNSGTISLSFNKPNNKTDDEINIAFSLSLLLC